MKGISTNLGLTDRVDGLRGAGVEFVFRYYGGSLSKRLTVAEARAISGAGMKMGVFYQEYNNAISHFSPGIGAAQAQRALEAATAIGQPGGSSIYFAVDFDPTPDQVKGAIQLYFQEIQGVLAKAATAYRVGVYGSGLVCQTMKALGLAQLACLSDSSGFRGSAAYGHSGSWDVRQSLAREALCDLRPGVEGDYELCVTHEGGDFGAFTLTSAWHVFLGAQDDGLECRLLGDRAYVPLRRFFTRLFGETATLEGLSVEGGGVTWQGRSLGAPARILDGVGYAPVRDLAAAMGLEVHVQGTEISLTRTG